jgi:hypothetical protein
MKITRDGFVWLTLEEDQAKKIYKHEIEDVYVLYDDDSEGLVERVEQISEAFENGNHVGIEVGQLHCNFVAKKKAISAFKENCQHPKDTEGCDCKLCVRYVGGHCELLDGFIEKLNS